MSTAQGSDIFIVNRGGISYQVTFTDLMSTARDSDLLLINRGGQSYKITYADFANSQIPPVVGTVTLSDSPQAERFTNATFEIDVLMTENGVPASDKALKAWVEGTLASSAVTSAITNVDTLTYIYSDSAYFTTNDTLNGPERAFDGNFIGSDISTFATTVNTGIGIFLKYVYPEPLSIPEGGFIGFATKSDPLLYEVTVEKPDGTRVTVSWNSASGPLDTDVGNNGVVAIGTDITPYLPPDQIPPTRLVYIFQVFGPCTFVEFKSTSQTSNARPCLGGVYLGDWLLDNATQTILTLDTPQDLDKFLSGDSVTELGNNNDGVGDVQAVTYVGDLTGSTSNTILFTQEEPNWDVGSQVKGPLKPVTVTPESDEITAVQATVNPTYSNTLTSSNGYVSGSPADLFDGDIDNGVVSNAGGTLTWDASPYGLSGALRVRVYSNRVGDPNAIYLSVNGGPEVDTSTLGPSNQYNWYDAGNVGSINEVKCRGALSAGAPMAAIEVNGIILIDDISTATLTFASDKDLAIFAVGDAVNQEDSNASGTVDSVDTGALTMTVAPSTGTWGPANDGHYVIGPAKPSDQVKLYTIHDSTGAVTDLTSIDPGYVTLTTSNPYSLQFPATFPSGNPPDTDLPPGTDLQVEIKASNTVGADTKASNLITPA